MNNFNEFKGILNEIFLSYLMALHEALGRLFRRFVCLYYSIDNIFLRLDIICSQTNNILMR